MLKPAEVHPLHTDQHGVGDHPAAHPAGGAPIGPESGARDAARQVAGSGHSALFSSDLLHQDPEADHQEQQLQLQRVYHLIASLT
ncbi:MAG: hypothetical protein A2Z71_03970 [Chloroflexi bacterium RBG_13_50_21]|nr:MAG: hypothetical protein A2Z71_03970 [Chloroflexi bacterium RBG_13_50_21]